MAPTTLAPDFPTHRSKKLRGTRLDQKIWTRPLFSSFFSSHLLLVAFRRTPSEQVALPPNGEKSWPFRAGPALAPT